jgi:hypothetical protein
VKKVRTCVHPPTDCERQRSSRVACLLLCAYLSTPPPSRPPSVEQYRLTSASRRFAVKAGRKSGIFLCRHLSSVSLHPRSKRHRRPSNIAMTPLQCTRTSSAARSFLLLARRTYSSVAAQTSLAAPPPLEFLVPRCALPRAASRKSPSSIRSPAFNASRFIPATMPRRGFTATAFQRATVCVQNPQKDEDGNDMMLEITPRAAKVGLVHQMKVIAGF